MTIPYQDERPIAFGFCWWCGVKTIDDDLVHLEGARLAGSPELFFDRAAYVLLPYGDPERVRVCRRDALDVFVEGRKRHELEVLETEGSRLFVRDVVLEAIRRAFGDAD